MDNDPASPADIVTKFAAAAAFPVVPAIPRGEPEVRLGPGKMSLPEFLELSGKIGADALYLRAAPAGRGHETPASHGNDSQVTVAFVSASGLLHLWSGDA